MWNKKASKKRIAELDLQALKEIHKVCSHCGITGHRVDMFYRYEPWMSVSEYYHNGCYAEKFKKHLCPCKCGRWIDNKTKK